MLSSMKIFSKRAALTATGRTSTATRTAFQTAQRSMSYLFLRYTPRGEECLEFEKLVTEYAETNKNLLEYYPVSVMYTQKSTSINKNTLGGATATTPTPDLALNLLKKLESAPLVLPSGRPSMSASLRHNQLGIFLTASPADPYVTKFNGPIETITQKLAEFGTIERINVLRRHNWPIGNIYCDFKEDDAAKIASAALNGCDIPDLEMPLEANIAKFLPYANEATQRRAAY